jgi:ribosomal protein S18 acetylase RimI-like enzyme
VKGMLTALDEERRGALLKGMEVIQSALGGSAVAETADAKPIVTKPPVTLRPHRVGDMGWVVQRHGELYAQEYGWNEEFEALVAEITVEFIRKLDPIRERCWIAEREGKRIGCIFLVAKDATTAKLRLLLVEPETRGLGVGRTLVSECVKFGREVGYHKIVLWTQENLTAARHLYDQAGFQRMGREPHHSFGHDLVAETWELELR